MLLLKYDDVEIHSGIYKHFKGGFYKVQSVAFNHEDGVPVVVYQKCDESGLYLSIRDTNGNVKVKQPFYRSAKEFTEWISDKGCRRFTLVKETIL